MASRPYVIIVYDVEQARVAKVCQFLRRYLTWVQNSAFEGELTPAQLKRVCQGLKAIIDPDYDSVYIYQLPHGDVLQKQILGVEKSMTDVVV